MSTVEVLVPDSESLYGVDAEVVNRAISVAPILRENAVATEQAGKLAEESVAALTKNGLFDLAKPSARGGLETSIRTMCRVLVELGKACPSSSWVTAVSNTAMFSSSRLPQSGQDRLYSQWSGSRMCGNFAPASDVKLVDGGYLVSGSWGYSSGSNHADWFFSAIAAPTAAGGIDVGQALIPMSAATIERTWDVAGLKGTGSDTIHVKDAFVPEDMFLSIAKAASGETVAPYDGALYRTDWIPATTVLVVAPLVGAAKGALEFARQTIGSQPLTYTTYAHTREAAPTYVAIAEAAQSIEIASALLDSVAERIDRASVERRRLPEAAHAELRMQVGSIAKLVREAMDSLMDAGGSSAFKMSNLLQRHWRDIGVGTRHASIAYNLGREFYGRSLMGLTQTARLL